MVCPRCIATVGQLLAKVGIGFSKIELGEAFLTREPKAAEILALQTELTKSGFELIENRVNKIVEDIKLSVAAYLDLAGSEKINLSSFISKRIPYDYSYLSDLFSSVESKSIEQYFIGLRIEKVKEYIVYDQLSFTEIAYRVGFSSVHHLSAQFRKVTGLTPSHFKRVGSIRRLPIDKL